MRDVNQKHIGQDFPGGSMVKKSPATAGDIGLIPSPGGSYTLWGNEVHESQLMKPKHPEPMLHNKKPWQ